MAVSNMWGSFVGPWGGGSLASATSYGMVFTPTVDGAITLVGFRRRGSGSAYLPNYLQVWRVNDQVKMWETTTPTDSGAIQWQWTTVSGGIGVEANVSYVVVMHLAAGKETVSVSGGSVPAYGANLQKPSLFRRYIVSGTPAFPTNNDASEGIGVDIEFDSAGTGAPDDTPVSELDLDNALGRWFSANSDNTRQTHLPWLTKAVVDTIAATQTTHTGSIAAVAPTVMGAGGPTLATLAGQVATAVGLTAVEAAVNSFVAGLLGNQGQDTIHQALTAIAQQTSTNRSPQDVIPVGGTGWTLMDTITGIGPKAWTHDADAYTLDIDVVGSNTRMRTVLDGVEIFYMRGFAWWWDGTHTGHRIEVNGILNVIRQPQARYPGLLLDVPTDVEWTLRAWDYTA